jgi:hypothetical protein
VYITFCVNFGESDTQTLASKRQAFDKETVNRPWVFEKFKFTEAGK